MPESQNGWTVIPDNADGRSKLAELVLPGTMPHPVRVLVGDVAVVFAWLVREYQARVEPIQPAGCWGWNVRKIEGSNSYSNHASGTAIDLNAPAHPMGVDTDDTFSAAQIRACHAIRDELDGVVRWGGDYAGRPDGMHWEINKGSAAVKLVADRIREEDMPSGEDLWKTDIIPNPKQRGDSATNKNTTAYFAVGDIWQLLYNLRDTVAAQGRQLAALSTAVATLDVVDDADRVEIARQILAGLPPELAKQVADELSARLAS